MSRFSKTFTEEEIMDIRTSYRQAKEPKKQISILAELYACEKSDIEYVIKDLKQGSTKTSNKGSKRPRTQLPKHQWTSDEVEELISLKSSNLPLKEIAAHFGVSVPAVQGQLMKHKNQESNKCKVSIPEPEVRTLPFIVEPNIEAKSHSSQITDLNYFTAIEYLKEFQVLVSNVRLSTTDDVLNFGKALGELAYKVGEFLREADKDGQ